MTQNENAIDDRRNNDHNDSHVEYENVNVETEEKVKTDVTIAYPEDVHNDCEETLLYTQEHVLLKKTIQKDIRFFIRHKGHS